MPVRSEEYIACISEQLDCRPLGITENIALILMLEGCGNEAICAQEEDRIADLEGSVGPRPKNAAYSIILLDPGHQTLVVVLPERGFRKFRGRAIGDENERCLRLAKTLDCALFVCSVQKTRGNDLVAQGIAPFG